VVSQSDRPDRDERMSNRRADTETARPAELDAIPDKAVVHLDVRDDLRQGREPFRRIMNALEEVPEAGVLTVRAIFEPVPLYRVMATKGLDHWTEQLGSEDWRVWFFPAGAELGNEFATGAASASPSSVAGDPADREAPESGETVLDVRGLEPPEPMVRTLAALEELAPGETLIQVNVRVPRFLLPKLAERGFRYDVLEESDEKVRIAIRHDAGD